SRPLDLDRNKKFLTNPCELAPSRDSSATGDDCLAPRPPDDSSGELIGSDVRPLGDRGAVLDVVRSLVATRVELPVRAIRIDQRLLQDLHLNSLTVGELVGDASRRLGLPAPAAPTDYARATVGEIAQALDELRRTACTRRGVVEDPPLGVASWTRCFTVELVERPRRSEAPSEEAGNPSIIAPPGYVLADRLREALRAFGPRPWVIVCLPPDPDETHVGLLIEGARAVESART